MGCASGCASASIHASASNNASASAFPQVGFDPKDGESPIKVSVAVQFGSMNIGTKYYVTVGVGRQTITFFVDTGSQVSLIKPDDSKYLKRMALDSPVNLLGFDGKASQEADQCVDLKLKFFPGESEVRMLVADMPENIIGCDLLKNPSSSISLDTKTGLLRVGTESIQTAGTEAESIALFAQRRRDADIGDGGISGVFRLSGDTVLPPQTMIMARAVISGKTSLKGDLYFYYLRNMFSYGWGIS